MLALDNPLWAELQHAYGSAKDIPSLLTQLASETGSNKQICFDLWSALAHQGDVYQASFAAVPHIVELVAAHPERATFDFFGFISWVEICRVRHGMTVDPRLAAAYHAALARIPDLVVRIPSSKRDAETVNTALSAVAAAWGFLELAEAIQDLDSQTVPDFRTWMENR